MLTLAKTCLATALTAALFLLYGCSQPSNPPAGESATKASEPSSPPEPVTAKTAYLPLYKSAYKWAPDVVLLRITPKEIPGFENAGGKGALWEATFASPSQHMYRVFSYAIAAHPPDIYKGVTLGNGIPWAGPTRDVMPIATSDFNVDSDAAYTAAAADAAAWLQKNPDKKLSSFQLGNGYSFPSPVWYVMWGDKKSGYVAIVSATTGKVLKKK
jgi:hypothetical protein